MKLNRKQNEEIALKMIEEAGKLLDIKLDVFLAAPAMYKTLEHVWAWLEENSLGQSEVQGKVYTTLLLAEGKLK